MIFDNCEKAEKSQAKIINDKLLRAYGECLGVIRLRKTWLAAISFGELLNKL